MTWSPLPVPQRIIACERPFSFYFGLIEPFWKVGDPHEAPLHRLATLARKQGAKALIIEDASGNPCVIDEVNAIDAHFGHGGAAECVTLSFLTEIPQGDDIVTVSAKSLIGQCTLINYRTATDTAFKLTYILEALFATPSLNGKKALLNNFIFAEGTFEVPVLGRSFKLAGVCYAQQNSVTSVCAHVSIRMVERTLFPTREATSSVAVNTLLGETVPSKGLFPEDIATALEKLTGHQVAHIDCAKLEPSQYVSILTAAADSGEIALLIFKTGAERPPAPLCTIDEAPQAGSASPMEAVAGPTETALFAEPEEGKGEDHVVVGFGYTRNSDEWRPLAIPTYTGHKPSLYRPASMWVDHFVIHDDNFGPYLTLSSRALEGDRTVRAEKILIVRRRTCTLSADLAETVAAIFLSMTLPGQAPRVPESRWLDLVTRYRGAFVLRPVLVTRQEYRDHVNAMAGHDASQLEHKLTTEFDILPDLMWMVEFSLPDLFTGNRAKLGEVLIDANVKEDQALDTHAIRGARLPGRLILSEPVPANGAPQPTDLAKKYGAATWDVPLDSHTTMFMRKQQDHLW